MSCSETNRATLETSPKKCSLLKNKKEALARGGKEAPQAGDGHRSVHAGLAECGEPWPDCAVRASRAWGAGKRHQPVCDLKRQSIGNVEVEPTFAIRNLCWKTLLNKANVWHMQRDANGLITENAFGVKATQGFASLGGSLESDLDFEC